MFCGHEGYFYGNVIVTPFAVVVTTKDNKPVCGDTLVRKNLNAARWHISDECGGYWGAMVGVFVLPREAVTLI